MKRGTPGYAKPFDGRLAQLRRYLGGFAAPRCNPTFTKQKLLDAAARGEISTFEEAKKFKYGN